MPDMGELIKKLRLEQNMTLEDLGNKVGVGKSTVRKWENGIIANMRRDKIEKIADALNVSPGYLMGWEDNIQNSENELFSKYSNLHPIEKKTLPMLGSVACGKPIFMNEERESYVEVGTEVKADYCLRAKGDSMINAKINDGDIIFVRQQSTVENGEIAVVAVDNEATLKRVYYYPDTQKLILQAENPAYAPLLFVGEELENVHILGKAVALQTDIK